MVLGQSGNSLWVQITVIMDKAVYIISPFDLLLYSKCPMYWYYERLSGSVYINHPLRSITQILTQVMEIAYTTEAQSNTITSWKMLRSRTGDIIYRLAKKGVEIPKDLDEILSPIYDWYYRYYLNKKEWIIGLPNIPLELPIGNNILLRDRVPVMLLDKEDRLAVFDFVDEEYTQNINRDLIFLTRIWLLSKVWNIPKKYVRFRVRKKNIISDTIFLDREKIDKHLNMITIILNNIKNAAIYPSITEQCSTCKWSKKCQEASND